MDFILLPGTENTEWFIYAEYYYLISVHLFHLPEEGENARLFWMKEININFVFQGSVPKQLND